jgi:hypothetical protein
MSAVTNVALAPFALLFRISYANPWLAMLVSLLAAVAAWQLDQPTWAVIFAGFMSYMLIWLDESEQRAAAAPVVGAD